MTSYQFALPQSLTEKDLFSNSTTANVRFNPPDAFAPAKITKTGDDDDSEFSALVEAIPRAHGRHGDGSTPREKNPKATLFLSKGDKVIAEILLNAGED